MPMKLPPHNMALQRTRRPRLRSGRSLRSLGSPLNAQPLAGPPPFATLLLTAACLASTACHSYWAAAGSFESELRCGMAPGEVSALAERHGGAPLWAPASRPGKAHPTHVLRQKSSSFEFWFTQSGLEWFRQGRHYGITGLELSPYTNVCTGEKTRLPFNLPAPGKPAG
jgi:hypothetical protein